MSQTTTNLNEIQRSIIRNREKQISIIQKRIQNDNEELKNLKDFLEAFKNHTCQNKKVLMKKSLDKKSNSGMGNSSSSQMTITPGGGT